MTNTCAETKVLMMNYSRIRIATMRTLTLEKNLTEITRNNNTVSTKVLTKLTKFPVHWSSKIPTNNKCSPSTSELHRATIITKDFEKKRIVNTKMII